MTSGNFFFTKSPLSENEENSVKEEDEEVK